MKRGFLNTARSKRVIEEAYAPASPPVPKARHPDRSSSLPRQAQDGGEMAEAEAVQEVAWMDAKMGAVEEVYADDQVDEAQKPAPDSPPHRTQDGSAEAAPARNVMDTEMTAVEEVYADGQIVVVRVRRPSDSEEKKPAPELPLRTQDGSGGPVPARNAMDAEMTAVEEVHTDDQVVVIERPSEDGEETPAAKLPPYLTQDSGEEAGPARNVMVAQMTAVEEVPGGDQFVTVLVRWPTEVEGETGAQARPQTNDPKGKGKAKAVDDIMYMLDSDPSPCFVPPRYMHRNRRGWGRHPDEDFFHTVPPSIGFPGRKRTVFRIWPRDPNGKPLVPSDELKGTLSPDGYPWGATLYDFYVVSRLPDLPFFRSIMTGSAIYQGVKALRELDFAAPEIEWAKSEGKPRKEGVANTAELIGCIDTKLQLLGYFNFPSHDTEGEERREQSVELDEEDIDGEAGNEDESDEEGEPDPADGTEIEHDDIEPIFIPPSPTIPTTSPFHPSHYPKPWPFSPFGHSNSILLQERIPLYLLPGTLYVHDPFNLLTAHKQNFCDTSWTSRPDIVRTYDLHRSDSQTACREYEKAKRKAKELEEFKARTLIILRYERTKEQIKNHEPVIEIPLPLYPRRIAKIEESHLYLSPIAKVGDGHHSIVYRAEWELPRDLFMKPTICQLCFEESANREIQRLKDTGKWEKLLRAISWGPNGFTGRQPTQAELDEVRDSPRVERDAEIIEREITCIVPPGTAPSEIFKKVDDDDFWGMFMKEGQFNNVQLRFAKHGDEDQSTEDSEVAIIRIDTPFTYESQKSCTHASQPPAPRTAIFTVIAKLSLEGDDHIVQEARNYQKFPERFFHHYNGYTIIPQLHTIIPVNAVVPQFYGFYTPRKDNQGNLGQPPYLSPILLLEHCGKPINPKRLTLEEQEECVSLLLRFQRAGWLHESFAPRNFLVQRGRPTEFPSMRLNRPERSFRLIDFGRSRKYECKSEKREEENEALSMFQKLDSSMNITHGSVL